MSRRSQSHYRSNSKLKKSISFDFSNAKGAGASIVFDYDHHKNRVPERREFSSPQSIKAEQEKRAQRSSQQLRLNRIALVQNTVRGLEISPNSFLETAHRLANFSRDPYKPIPQDLRSSMAIAVEMAGGSTRVAGLIRMGKMDDQLHHLIRRK